MKHGAFERRATARRRFGSGTNAEQALGAPMSSITRNGWHLFFICVHPWLSSHETV